MDPQKQVSPYPPLISHDYPVSHPMEESQISESRDNSQIVFTREKGDANKGRKKIPIALIQDEGKRRVTFRKRKIGLMTKAKQLSILTGADVLLLLESEYGYHHTFSTRRFESLLTHKEWQNLLNAYLTGKEPRGRSRSGSSSTSSGSGSNSDGGCNDDLKTKQVNQEDDDR